MTTTTVAFKASTKKRKSNRRAGGREQNNEKSFHTNDSDEVREEEEDESFQVVVKRKKPSSAKRKKKKATSGDSIDTDEENDNISKAKRKKKKKREKHSSSDRKKEKRRKKFKKSSSSSGGLGFGGGPMSIMSDEEEDENDGNGIQTIPLGGMSMSSIHHDSDEYGNGNYNDNKLSSTTTNMYGKEALEQLKSEQKTFVENKEIEESQDNGVENHPNEKLATNASTTVQFGNTEAQASHSVPSVKERTIDHNAKMKENGEGDDPFGSKDFISLNGSSKQRHSKILTGDEAILLTRDEDEDDGHYNSYGTKQDSKGSNKFDAVDKNINISKNSPASSTVLQETLMGSLGDHNKSGSNKEETDLDEGVRSWEDQIARRAGVGINNDGKKTVSTPVPANGKQAANYSKSSVNSSVTSSSSKIKETIQTTLLNLNQTELDVESSINRRTHEHEQAQKEALKKETELSSTGKSFEFYQRLRLDLANWAGALRHVDSKINDIEDALAEIMKDISSTRQERWKDWEDDVIESLVNKDWLDHTIGRQSSVTSTRKPMVDEFGRDITSMESLAKMKKRRERVRALAESRSRRNESRHNDDVIKQVKADFEDSDGDMSDNDLMDREERRFALSDAVQVVLGEIDEEYTNISKLIILFQDWQTAYPEDYQQCYANLSLVDLLGVLLRAEFCRSLDLHCSMIRKGKQTTWKSIQYHPWFQELTELGRQSASKEEGEGNESMESLLIDKICKNRFEIALNGSDGSKSSADSQTWGFDPTSDRQSCAMSDFYVSLQPLVSGTEDLCAAMIKYLKRFLNAMSIPILKHNIVPTILENIPEDEHDLDIVTFATIGQLHRLFKLVSNVKKYWYPQFQGKLSEEIAQFCVTDVIVYRILPILESMKPLDKNTDSKSMKEAYTSFNAILELIKDAGWFDLENLMLYTAPIRAVMTSFQPSP